MTLAKRVIPCLDVIAGRVMKGVAFIDLRDAGDPAELAARYDQDKADEIVFLDITASSGRTRDPPRRGGADCRPRVHPAHRRRGRTHHRRHRCAPTSRRRQGVDQHRSARRYDADRTGGRSIRPPVRRHCHRRAPCGGGYEVYSHGGRRATGRAAIEWAREAAERGAGEILLTSMDQDGTGNGYDLDLTASVVMAVDVPVIASGGAGSPEHLRSVLIDASASAALAASIFHFDAHPVAETKQYLHDHGVEVRL